MQLSGIVAQGYDNGNGVDQSGVCEVSMELEQISFYSSFFNLQLEHISHDIYLASALWSWLVDLTLLAMVLR